VNNLTYKWLDYINYTPQAVNRVYEGKMRYSTILISLVVSALLTSSVCLPLYLLTLENVNHYQKISLNIVNVTTIQDICNIHHSAGRFESDDNVACQQIRIIYEGPNLVIRDYYCYDNISVTNGNDFYHISEYLTIHNLIVGYQNTGYYNWKESNSGEQCLYDISHVVNIPTTVMIVYIWAFFLLWFLGVVFNHPYCINRLYCRKVEYSVITTTYPPVQLRENIELDRLIPSAPSEFDYVPLNY
jgi:hypothetical protein